MSTATADVYAFKMVSGEEVIAELKSTITMEPSGKPISYHVRRPHILQFQPVGPGQMGLALVPWTLADPTIENLEIPGTAILLKYPAGESTARQYLQQTSGIALAPAGLKV